MLQELRAFLEIEGSLSDSYQWRQLHPLQGSLMEGLSRLPKQLLGAHALPVWPIDWLHPMRESRPFPCLFLLLCNAKQSILGLPLLFEGHSRQ